MYANGNFVGVETSGYGLTCDEANNFCNMN